MRDAARAGRRRGAPNAPVIWLVFRPRENERPGEGVGIASRIGAMSLRKATGCFVLRNSVAFRGFFALGAVRRSCFRRRPYAVRIWSRHFRISKISTKCA
jgi:hypothetical protein